MSSKKKDQSYSSQMREVCNKKSDNESEDKK